MKTPEFFRKQRMMTQLCFTFGFIVVFVFGMFIAMWAIAVFSLRDSIISESRSNLRDQVAEVGRRISEEAAEVFQTKISVGTLSFLSPISIALFDATLGSGYSIKPLPSFTAEKLESLKQPLSGDEDRFECNIEGCPPAAEQSNGGCQCDAGLKLVSLGASSVFQTGMDGSDPAARLSGQIDQVEQSSYIDAFLKDVWRENPDWIQVYVGMPGSSSLFRSYPGSVREHLDDPTVQAPQGRTYDPVVRPWYTEAVARSPAPSSARSKSTQIEAPDVIVSQPYEDADGKGVLISVSSAIYGADRRLLGVAGLDLFVSSLRDFIVTIKQRESGEAFLFHVASDLVLASVQLDERFRWTLGSSDDTLPPLRQLSLTSKSDKHFSDLSDDEYPCRKALSGDAIKHGVMLLWTPVFEAAFCLVVATPVDEIDLPIEIQLDEIQSGASELFNVPLLLCLGCGIAVLFIVILIADELSRPLKKSAAESERIAQSIGHPDIDLRVPEQQPGVFQACCQAVQGNVGEVKNLRSRFQVLLNDLVAKRQVSAPETNPLVDKISDFKHLPAFSEEGLGEEQRGHLTSLSMLGGVEVKVDVQNGQDAAPVFVDSKTRWNALSTQLVVKVILPLLVCICAIVIFASGRMNTRATEWAKPVQEQIIAEELQSLEQRVQERALFVTEYLTRERNTLLSVHQYWRHLIEGDFEFQPQNPPTAFLGPQSSCGRYLSNFNWSAAPGLVDDGTCKRPRLYDETLGQTANSNFQPAQAKISVEGTGIFVPRYTLESDPANDGRRPPKPHSPGYDVGTMPEEAAVMGHMTNAMRVGFFSTVPTDIYIGTHQNEAMYLFPTTDMEGYNNPAGPSYCDSVRVSTWGSIYQGFRTTTYNPVCRPWYQRASEPSNVGKVVFNPVDFAAGYDQPVPYLALSSALWVSEQLVGVVALDVRLGQLYSALQSTPLYEKGYAFIWDINGLAVVHKGIKAGLEDMSIGWVDATSGGDYELDENWFNAQKEGIFDKGRITGSWKFTWNNMAKNQMEVWHYTFTPIEDTPYMLALSVYEPDVTKQADDMLAKLKAKVSTAATITACLIVFGCLALAGLVYWFNKKMAVPINELSDFMAQMQASKYKKDLSLREDSAGSREMRDIIENMHKMLVALRFCNKDYTEGDPRRELDTCCDALVLVQKTENKAGEGICYNNMGNICRTLEAQKIQYSKTVNGHGGSAIVVDSGKAKQFFDMAVENARSLPDSTANKTDLITSRLFNLALYQASKGNREESERVIQEAFAASSAETIVRLAFGGMKEYVDRRGELWLYRALAAGAERALAMMSGKGDNMPASIAEACAVLSFTDYHLDNRAAASSRAWWALSNLSHMSTACGKVLLFCALVGSEDSVIDYAIRNAQSMLHLDHVVKCAKQRKPKNPQEGSGEHQGADGGAAPQAVAKSVIFTIDISGSMQMRCDGGGGGGGSGGGAAVEPTTFFILHDPKAAARDAQPTSIAGGTRLDVCKKSLLQAIENIIKPGDELGLYVFDNNFEPVYNLQPAPRLNMMSVMSDIVKNINVRGGTAFWDALKKSMTLFQDKARLELSSADQKDSWIIALTDGEDQHSQESSFPWVVENIKCIKVNLVVITVATEAATPFIKMIKESAEQGEHGNKIMHIAARNEEIAQAFGQVEAMLSTGGYPRTCDC